MKITFDNGDEYELTEIDSVNFIVVEPKADSPMPLPYKDDWNDPNSTTVQRKYKAIKIGDKYYGIERMIR